jgi:hypothetical protein
VKPFIVYDAKTGQVLGRILARPGYEEAQAKRCWPGRKYRIEPVEKP